jgi:hypothetical protein
MTFYAEMVISIYGELREAVARLEKALREGYTGRNAASVHFLYSKPCILAYVPFLWRKHTILSGKSRYEKQCNGYDLI